MRHHTRNTAVLILLASLALAGCGDDADSGSMPGASHGSPTTSGASSAPAGDFNDADVTFATMMIPHHQQAVQMSEMAARKATTAGVKKLATQIKAAQGPEITQLSGWLTGWGKPVPSQSHAGHGDEMPGMMTEDEMASLGNTSGAAFDRRWTQLMIEHHLGAVTMARTERTAGKNAAAIVLAKKIETDQNREIATMRLMLGKRPSR